ncbi:MAG: hypothetical protein JWQ23_4024, partial [Herminiimonas sp.]|nr:hypothetical protein [Herminiimonas sp.]
MDKSKRSSEISRSKSSSSIDESSFSADSTHDGGLEKSGKSGKAAPGISTRAANREASQARHQAERQNRIAEGRRLKRNTLLNDILQKSINLESKFNQDFGFNDPVTEDFGYLFQRGPGFAREEITQGTKEFNSFLKKPKFTSSLSESAALNSDAGAEVERSIALKIMQHYKVASRRLDSAQNAYVDQR